MSPSQLEFLKHILEECNFVLKATEGKNREEIGSIGKVGGKPIKLFSLSDGKRRFSDSTPCTPSRYFRFFYTY